MGVRFVGLNNVLRKMDAEYLIAPAVEEMLRDAASEGERVAREGAPSEVAARIHGEISSFHSNIVSMHPASAPIEYGRRPGAPMPPLSAIARWVAGRVPGAGVFVIARAIARRGVRGRFFMRAAERHLTTRSRAYAREASHTIEKRWRA